MSICRCLLWFSFLCFLASVAAAQVDSNVKTETIAEVVSKTKWTKAPTGFQGTTFGSRQEAVAEIAGPLRCEDTPTFRRCKPTDPRREPRVADRVIIHYLFVDGKLAGVELASTLGVFSALAPFSDVIAFFRAQYGEPTVDRTVRQWGTIRQTVYTGKKPSLYETKVQYVNDVERCLQWTSPAVEAQICGDGRRNGFGQGSVVTAEFLRLKAK